MITTDRFHIHKLEKKNSFFIAVITDLLDKVLNHTLLLPDSEVFPLKPCKVTDSALKGQKLTDLQMLGIKMVIR